MFEGVPVSELVAEVATPAPTPTSEYDGDETEVTPGPWGFLIFALIAVAAVVLIIDMVRRVRRLRYREEIRERLADEVAARADDRAPDAEPDR